MQREIIPRSLVGSDDLFIPVATKPKVARTDTYDVTTHLSGPLPPGSPLGYPWMLWKGSKAEIRHSGGFGMDSSGVWWNAPDCSSLKPGGSETPGEGFCLWGMTSPSTGIDWTDEVQEFTKNVVLPTIGLVVGTAIGGVGGIIAATIITAATKISKGGRVSDAVVSSTKDALPSLVASGVFDKTIAQAKAYGLDKMYEYGKTIATGDERDAFAKAATIATSIVSQQKSLEELKAKFPDQAAIIEQAASNQASPLDIANAIGGEKEKVAMDQALVRNAGGNPNVSSSVTITAKSVAAGGGGAVAGWFLGGPIGAVIGGGLGYFLGSKL